MDGSKGRIYLPRSIMASCLNHSHSLSYLFCSPGDSLVVNSTFVTFPDTVPRSRSCLSVSVIDPKLRYASSTSTSSPPSHHLPHHCCSRTHYPSSSPLRYHKTSFHSPQIPTVSTSPSRCPCREDHGETWTISTVTTLLGYDMCV